MKTLIFSILLMPFLVFSQQYQKRLALVIGNSEYENGGSLPNPVNDANSIAKALQQVGFEVLIYRNVSQKQMKMAINTFGQKLEGYDVGVFYYAGHGIQHKGLNYMIPIEADLQNASQIEFDCVAADRVLAFMDAAKVKVNVIILDACRNNPFERSWHRSSNGNGLAVMDAPTGSLIAYATAPGKVASDGEGSNGLYTSALLKYIGDSKLTIEQVFKRVRTEVTDKSSGSQVPWETTSLTGEDFYFANSAIKPGKIIDEMSSVVASAKEKTNTNSRATSTVNEEARKKANDLLSEGHTAYNAEEYSKASELYTQAIAINPNFDEAHYWRGSVFYTQNDYEKAILDYDKAIALNPYNEKAFYYRGISKYYLKKYNDAIEDLNKAIEFNPDVANAFYYRATSKYSLENYEEAILDYSKSIELNKTDGYSFGGRANCFYMLAKYKEAKFDYTKAIELMPNESTSYRYYRGISRFYLDEWREASDDLLAYYDQDPENGYLNVLLGSSLVSIEKYSDAIPYLSKAIPGGYNTANIYYLRGYAYFQVGNKTESLKDINKAISLDPQNESYLQFKKDNF